MGTVKADIFIWMEIIMLVSSNRVNSKVGENLEIHLTPLLKLETGIMVNFYEFIYSI
jgi:hypothetical protein